MIKIYQFVKNLIFLYLILTSVIPFKRREHFFIYFKFVKIIKKIISLKLLFLF